MTTPRTHRPSKRRPCGCVDDEQGVVAIWVTVSLAMFFAIGALVVDGGRLFNLHSQLVSYADHTALAAAAELDGNTGAIDRSIQVATGPDPGPLVKDMQSFGIGGPELAVERLVFLSALGDDPAPGDMGPRPAGDVVLCTYQAGGDDCTADDDLAANFIEVTVEPVAMNYLLLPVLAAFGIGVPTQGTSRAQAVAGSKRAVCNFPPLMICNPYEATEGAGAGFDPVIGQQILVKSKGENSAWGPGDFGLLSASFLEDSECATGGASGADVIRCALALVNPNTTCVEGDVDIRPGEAVSVHVGLNTRFDIWDPPLQTKMDDPAFAPAANVTKGKVENGQCRLNKLEDPPPPPDDTVRLPRDDCFATDTCTDGRFGDASFDLGGYWFTNHDGAGLPAGLTTRFDAYRYETDNGVIPDKSARGGEDGAGICSVNAVPGDSFNDRRMLVVAVVNCLEHGISGSTEDVPVEAFARMFMTEPVGLDGASTDDLWFEMLGVAEPGDQSGVVHDFPQLFR